MTVRMHYKSNCLNNWHKCYVVQLMLSGTTNLENNLAVPKKAKHRVLPFELSIELAFLLHLSPKTSVIYTHTKMDLPNPGIKPGLLHFKWILYQLSNQGNLCENFYSHKNVYVNVHSKIIHNSQQVSRKQPKCLNDEWVNTTGYMYIMKEVDRHKMSHII